MFSDRGWGFLLVVCAGGVLVSGCPGRTGSRTDCSVDGDCADALFCNGVERCIGGECRAGMPPCGAAETCVETEQACRPSCTADGECDDGLFCTGVELCVAGACQVGTTPCNAGELCDELGDRCIPDDGTNVAPFVANQSASTKRDTPAQITIRGTDPNGDALLFEVVDGPDHGTLGTIDNSAHDQAEVTYTPDNGFSGTDSFTVSASDGTMTSPPAVVTVDVQDMTMDYRLSLARFFGGSGEDTIRDIAYDNDGNIYIAGGTASTNLPTTAGAYQRTLSAGGSKLGTAGVHDAFVAKFDASGLLLWSTYLGGPNYDRAYALEVGADGFVYVGGRAGDGFPTTNGAVQTTFGGDNNVNSLYGPQDGFVAKLSPDGGQLVWSTLFGGNDRSFVRDIDVDADGHAYLAMTDVTSVNPHVTAGAFQSAHPGGRCGVVAKLSPDGRSVVWASYLGSGDVANGTPSIRVDSQGHAYVVGFTNSATMPATAGAFDTTYAGNGDLFLAKFRPDGTALMFGAFVGGSEVEFTETHALALAPNGDIIVGATTKSADFPVTAGAFQGSFGGVGGGSTGGNSNYNGDGFVARISSDGARLVAATFLGGRYGDGIEGVGVDSQGNIYVGGATYSDDFPTTTDGHQRVLRGKGDFFAVKLDAALREMLYGTLLGGGQDDFGRTLIATSDGILLVAGHTQSSNWPALGANASSLAGSWDGAFARIAP